MGGFKSKKKMAASREAITTSDLIRYLIDHDENLIDVLVVEYLQRQLENIQKDLESIQSGNAVSAFSLDPYQDYFILKKYENTLSRAITYFDGPNYKGEK